VDPSLVTLRLVKRGAGKPTAKQEEKAKAKAKAKVLDDPSLSLAQAKVTDTTWLLAFIAGTNNERLSTNVDAPGAYMTRTPLYRLRALIRALTHAQW
jgi:BRCT domain type II-containing protein